MLHFGIKSRAPLEGKRNFVPCSGRYVSRNAGVFIKQGENDGLQRAASTSCKTREERKTFSDGQNLLCETAYNYYYTGIKKDSLDDGSPRRM